MPLVAWDEQTFRQLYRGPNGDTYGLDYWGHPSVAHMFDWRALGLLELGVTPGQRVLVAGAAWGHLCHSLAKLDIDSIGCDSSPFVAAHQDEHLAPVVYADVRQLAPSDLPPGMDWVITESVLESYDAAEAHSVIDACHYLAPNVAHLVYTDLRPPFRNKSLGQWKRDDPEAQWASITAWGLS